MLPDPKMPTEEQFKKGMENSKTLTLYAGLPHPDDKIDEYLKTGAKIVYFLTPDEKKQFRDLRTGEAGVTWENDVSVKRFMFENLGLWVGGQIGGHDKGRAMQLAAILKDLVDLHNFDLASVEFLTKDKQPTRNVMRNYRWVEDGIPLRRARNLGKGATAVIIAAGPSLDTQWEQLVRIQKTAPNHLFIVAGRSYKQAMKRGLIPDFVVEVEQFDWDDKIWLFAPEPPEFTILCAPLTACPSMVGAWPGRKMMLVDHEMAQLMQFKIREDSIDGGNSILHHMFSLSLWLGCPNICLAGVDLSYPNGTKDTHADGTFPSWPREVLTQEHNRQEPLLVQATRGGEVWASPGYKNFCTFFEIQIEKSMKDNPGLKVYNFSPNGQKIIGTEFREIEKWNGPSSSPQASSASPFLPPPSSPLAFSCTLDSSAALTKGSA